MKVFVINLKKRTDRLEKIKIRLDKFDILSNYEIIEGIDCECDLDKYNFKVMDNWIDPIENRNIKIGEIATSLSHHKIWNEIVNNNINMALILEDDAMFKDNFDEYIIYLKEYIYNHPNVDGCYLGRNPLNNIWDLGEEMEINENLVIAKSSYNLHSYILTFNGAVKLINSKFIQNIIPIDEFFSIMYDSCYPWIKYSNHFASSQKLLIYSLKNNIAFQDGSYSTANNSSIYNNENIEIQKNKSIQISNCEDKCVKNESQYINKKSHSNKNEYLSQRLGEIWHISQLDLNVSEDKKIKYAKIIDSLFNDIVKMSDSGFNFALNMLNISSFSFIEKFIYDISSFHCNRLNIDINNMVTTFWIKPTPYNFDHIHTHLDHCDYEWRIHQTMNIKPIFTTLTYFNDNDCPTLVTDITRKMGEHKDFSNPNNNCFSLIFPKLLKHVCFDSGDRYHGESYTQNYDPDEIRKVLVIAVWNKDNSPLNVPNYDQKLFNYYDFIYNTQPIECDVFDLYSNPIVLFNDIKDKIDIINVRDNKLINYSFFNNLINNRKKDVLYPFHNIVNSSSKDTFIIDFSDIFITKNENLLDNFSSFWKINPIIDKLTETQIIDFIMNNNISHSIIAPKLIDTENQFIIFIEILVKSISNFHMKRLALNHFEYFVSYELTSLNMHIVNDLNNSKPFITSLTFFNDIIGNCDNNMSNKIEPNFITNISEENFKYKNFDNSETDIYCFYPKKWMNIIFNGDIYFSHGKALAVHIWKNEPNLNLYIKPKGVFDNFVVNNLNFKFTSYQLNHYELSIDISQKDILMEYLLYNNDDTKQKIQFINSLSYDNYLNSNNNIYTNFIKIIFSDKQIKNSEKPKELKILTNIKNDDCITTLKSFKFDTTSFL
jgi:GR25 family glycosyltransferase involved in LPS biosynthesis